MIIKPEIAAKIVACADVFLASLSTKYSYPPNIIKIVVTAGAISIKNFWIIVVSASVDLHVDSFTLTKKIHLIPLGWNPASPFLGWSAAVTLTPEIHDTNTKKIQNKKSVDFKNKKSLLNINMILTKY